MKKVIIVPPNTGEVREIHPISLVAIFVGIILLPVILYLLQPKVDESLIRREKDYYEILHKLNYLEHRLSVLERRNEALKLEADALRSHLIYYSDTTATSVSDFEDIFERVQVNQKLLELVEKEVSKDPQKLDYLPSILPVDGWLVKGFGIVKDRFTGEYRVSQGINIAAPVGTPVRATASGWVVFRGYKKGYGKMVIIQHRHGFRTLYAHLDDIKVGLGEFVKRGKIIGTVGTTGSTEGPQLHYEIRLYGIPQNPLNYIIEEVKTL